MGSMTKGSNGRATPEVLCNNIDRRMVNLPRSILGVVSRVVDQGIDLMRTTGRRNHHHLPPPPPQPPNYPLQQTQDRSFMNVQEEWTFLACFEQQYDLVIQFLDANFISWGAMANREEGLHMATTLCPDTFPFCAVVAPASGDSLAVLQQVSGCVFVCSISIPFEACSLLSRMKGPVSPSELVEIQRVMEKQGLAFGSARAKQEEKRRADQRLREEQDIVYLTALQIDQILIRFPNGERREKSFLCSEKIQAIYRYVDSVAMARLGGNYKLISSFPRKVYGFDEMGMSLKDAGVYPRASLFLEPV